MPTTTTNHEPVEILDNNLSTELVHAVRELARTNPDRIYLQAGNGCQYHADYQNPDGCIIGAAARALGFSLDHHADTGVGNLFDEDTDHVLQNWLIEVQTRQDDSETWGTAVYMADLLIEEQYG